MAQALGLLLTGEVMGKVAKNIDHASLRIPPEPAPDEFIQIIVAALGVGDEANGFRQKFPQDIGFTHGTRVDRLPSLGERIRHIPIRNRKLAACAVGDVRVEADGILRRQPSPHLLQRQPGLRPHHDAIEPAFRLSRRYDREEFLHPVRGEGLRRNPHLRPGMVFAQAHLLLLQQAQKILGLRMARVASGHKHHVDARQHLENSLPFGQGSVDRLRIGVILIHRRVPDRDIQSVAIRDPRHLDHHLRWGEGKERTVRLIV